MFNKTRKMHVLLKDSWKTLRKTYASLRDGLEDVDILRKERRIL